jgi:hypothetical protein
MTCTQHPELTLTVHPRRWAWVCRACRAAGVRLSYGNGSGFESLAAHPISPAQGPCDGASSLFLVGVGARLGQVERVSEPQRNRMGGVEKSPTVKAIARSVRMRDVAAVPEDSQIRSSTAVSAYRAAKPDEGGPISLRSEARLGATSRTRCVKEKLTREHICLGLLGIILHRYGKSMAACR